MRTAVVIPLYNGGPWIAQSLASLAAQTTPPAEIIVVDDASTDGSPDLVRGVPGLRLVRNPTKGGNPARHFGVLQCRAPFVAMHDQDDLWHPGHLSRLESLLEARPAAPAAVAGTAFFRGDARPAFSDPTDAATGTIDPWAVFPAAAVVAPSAVLIRRTALDAIGGWNCARGGDFATWLRLSASAPFASTAAITCGYRQHDATSSVALRSPAQRHAFLDRFLLHATEALPFRLQHHPEDTALLSGRLAVFQAMVAWVKAVDGISGESSRAAARRLDDALAHQPTAMIATLWDQVFYFCQDGTYHAAPLRKGAALLRLLWRCPVDASRLRRCLGAQLFRRLGENLQRRWPPWRRDPKSA